MTVNCRVRFCENNFAELTAAQIQFSSESAIFPFKNCINKFRSKVWKPTGYFEITSSNNKIYINDGSLKTITLTAGGYATPALLASHIQTKLNAASTDWTVSHLANSYKFKIERTSSATLSLSNQSNSVWSTIGFESITDEIGTEFIADEQRNHTSEFVLFDMGYNAQMTFLACIGPLDEVFSISSGAVITLKGNNLNEWNSPPFSITLQRNDLGIYKFFDEFADTGFRYWKLEIQDKFNPLGPNGISIGHLYLGDYVTLSDRNISTGITYKNNDQSTVSESENGTLYFDVKTKYKTVDGLEFQYLQKENRKTIDKMFNKLGKTTPFYIAIDPTEKISDLEEFTLYCVFSDMPSFRHRFSDMFDCQFLIREVL